MKNSIKRAAAFKGFLVLFCALSLVSFTFQSANAESILEVEANDTLATAQNIDPHFSVGANADITNSASTPWVSISATGNDTFDYYSFTVASAGDTGYFDIDYGAEYDANSDSWLSGLIDTELGLYTSTGLLLDWRDDSYSDFGAGGSNSHPYPATVDAYLEYSFTSAGTYIIGVGAYNTTPINGGLTGNTPDIGDTYTLQVSIKNYIDNGNICFCSESQDPLLLDPKSFLDPIVTPEPSTYLLLGSGIAGLVLWRRKKQTKKD